MLAQVIKRYVKGRVVEVEQRIVQDSGTLLGRLLWESQGGLVINTAFIARLNATFRQHLTCLVRRTRTLVHRADTLLHGMYLWHLHDYVFLWCYQQMENGLLLEFPGRAWRNPQKTFAV